MLAWTVAPGEGVVSRDGKERLFHTAAMAVQKHSISVV